MHIPAPQHEAPPAATDTVRLVSRKGIKMIMVGYAKAVLPVRLLKSMRGPESWHELKNNTI